MLLWLGLPSSFPLYLVYNPEILVGVLQVLWEQLLPAVLTSSAPVIPVFLLFIEHPKLSPARGSSQLLFFLLGTLAPQTSSLYQLVPLHHSFLSSRLTSSQASPHL